MSSNTGVMFVGLCGHLSTTAMAGAMAVSENLYPPTAMISEKKELKDIPFPPISGMIFGGWDIRSCGDAGKALKDTGIDDFKLLVTLTESLEKIQSKSFPGILLNAGEAICGISDKNHIFKAASLKDAVNKVKEDIRLFRQENRLDHVVVINLASTEPPLTRPDALASLASIEELIQENRIDQIRPSFVYAYGAITSGCAYINFTPSEGGFSQGLVDLALENRVPIMGSDGKTGETLVKSALAPMFAARHLEVLSWEGYNLLGNMDGQVLQNDENGATKIKSKDRLLPHILGHTPHSRVSIDYVPSLGDRKTAWDFIHFKGFLDTKMSLQFIWQGCDSALAAPLVLDLARFAVLSLKLKEKGVMTHLASFFKSPWKVDEHCLIRQYQMLEAYIKGIRDRNP